MTEPLDDKEPGFRMELVEMTPRARVSVLGTQQPKLIHIRGKSSRGELIVLQVGQVPESSSLDYGSLGVKRWKSVFDTPVNQHDATDIVF